DRGRGRRGGGASARSARAAPAGALHHAPSAHRGTRRASFRGGQVRQGQAHARLGARARAKGARGGARPPPGRRSRHRNHQDSSTGAPHGRRERRPGDQEGAAARRGTTSMIRPSLDDYRRLAREHNLIPVTREILADFDTPVSAFVKLNRGDASFLLESLEGGETWGRYSILGFRPSVEFRSSGTKVEIRRGEKTQRITSEDPLETLRSLLGEVRAAAVPGLPRFSGGAVGLIG